MVARSNPWEKKMDKVKKILINIAGTLAFPVIVFVEKYIKFLSSDKAASEKFWELEKKIKKDQKNPGVILELRKSDVPWDLAALIKKKVIKIDDISEFSEDLQEAVKLIIYGRED